jgi:acetyl-CoA synthetase
MSEYISNLMNEKRLVTPSSEFTNQANIKSVNEYNELCEKAENDPEAFWSNQAKKLVWDKDFSKTLDWQPPFSKWFVDGKLNASVQCLDKNLKDNADKTALIWEGEVSGEVRRYSYQELYELTCQAANALKALGVKTGDRVAIYLPMIPEAVAAMLACARLGAPHSVIFGGFSSESLKDRLNDMQCSIAITSDGGFRRGNIVPLKENLDKALKNVLSVKNVLVVKHAANKISMAEGRDYWWSELVPKQKKECEPISVDSENLLFILYTSGTTGKPKGIMHSTAGYMLATQLTTNWVFDLKPDDIYWCTADIGWVTGHSYVVYGPLQNAATIFMYEGAPNFPDFSRFWQMIDRHKITILYTAPTAIRAFMRAGLEFITPHNLKSLRLLGTVGEPINPEAWIWYHKTIGGERCPIVDTWWQTETGAIMMSPLPGITATKPGSCAQPLPGVSPRIVKKSGESCKKNEGGFLIIEKPWPSMMRGIYGDPDRFKKTYWSDFQNKYFTGDGARCDEDGYFWVMGRVDDVLNVAGHRLGTAEIESALVSYPKVAEAAVVGRPDALKGQAIVAFVTLKLKFADELSLSGSEAMQGELKNHVAREIGAIAKPDEIRFTDSLPKTRSGKIMRRLLREIAAGNHQVTGDTSTLEDESVVNKLTASYENEE